MENHNSLYKKEHKVLQCTTNFLAPPGVTVAIFTEQTILQLKFAELRFMLGRKWIAIFLGKMKSELKFMVLGSILLCRRQRLLEPPGIVNENWNWRVVADEWLALKVPQTSWQNPAIGATKSANPITMGLNNFSRSNFVFMKIGLPSVYSVV